MNKIPISFKLFASEYKVEIDNKTNDAKGNLGHALVDLKKIVLADKVGIDDLPEDTVLDTYYHELVHCILLAMEERQLTKNEKFVDLFGKLLRQYLETVKFE